jgi:hypothetical protein
MIPLAWVLIRFVRSLGRSLKAPEFQALCFLVKLTLASGAFLPAVRGVELSWLPILQRHHAHPRGYGDFSPFTRVGKVLTIFYVFFGIGVHPGVCACGGAAFDGATGGNAQVTEASRQGADSDAEKG